MLLAGDHWLSTRDFNSDSDTYGGPQVDPHDNWIIQRKQVRYCRILVQFSRLYMWKLLVKGNTKLQDFLSCVGVADAM